MKVLITGSNGYIGSYISQRLNADFTAEYIFSTNRQSLYLNDWANVNNFFEKNGPFDCVIHCAFSGGRRTIKDYADQFYENINSFENLVDMRNKIKKFITFGSGAESFYFLNNNYYAQSKKIIAERIRLLPGFYNLRIFGCFGGNEEPQRFIRKSITKAVKGEELIITQNRLMGFIHIEDLYKIVKYYLINNEEENLPKEVNVNYEYFELYKTAKKIINFLNSTSNIKIEKDGYDIEYFGDPSVMYSLPIDFMNPDESLKMESLRIRNLK